MFALTLPVLIGGAAFGVETAYWQYRDRELQTAADAAAYSAAIEKRAGKSLSAIQAAALAQAQDNGFTSADGTITVSDPPTSGPNQAATAIEVILTQRQTRFFTKVFTDGDVTARARSVALFQNASTACILALDPSASGATTFAGSSIVDLVGCSVMSNSVASDAFIVQGSAQITAPCAIAVGGIQTTGGLHLTDCSAPVTQAPPVADPFGDVPAPATDGTCANGNAAVLSPGKYCGLNLSGTVTLQPGVYVISGGDFKINANANISGAGVTFYLTGGSRIQFNGNAEMHFSAPTSGTYSGILFFGDRSSIGGSNTFNGTADSSMIGALYFASQTVSYLGDFTGSNGCTQVVANQVSMSGNTQFNADCTSHGMQVLPGMQLIRIVE